MFTEKKNLTESIKATSIVDVVLEAIPAPVFYKHKDGRYLGCNSAFEKFVGKSKTDLLNKTVYELWNHDLAQIYQNADDNLLNSGGKQIYEAQVTYADGSIRDVVFHKAVFNIEQSFNGLVGVMLDVTDRNNALKELKTVAQTDSLTGLYNRAYFYEQAPKIIANKLDDCDHLTLLAVDVDHFKKSNDQYGHLTGDQILIHVANRLKSSTRKDDLIARIGGDEFLLLLRNIPSQTKALELAQKMLSHITDTPFKVSGHQINISISIGVLHGLSPKLSLDKLVHHADIALYRAKKTRNTIAL